MCLFGFFKIIIKISDCRKLERDFPEVTSQKMVDQCVDLGVYCNEVMNTGGRWSMERLVWYLVRISIVSFHANSNIIIIVCFCFFFFLIQCRLKINKDKKVRNSKWHIMPLSPEQQIYAAIDVYVSTKTISLMVWHICWHVCVTNVKLLRLRLSSNSWIDWPKHSILNWCLFFLRQRYRKWCITS